VFHIQNQVCVAKAFDGLPEKYRLGILMHELGHILAGPEGSEGAANRAITAVHGIPVSYGGPLDLEYVDRRDFEHARTILTKEFS
jgi:hypothetical protein